MSDAPERARPAGSACSAGRSATAARRRCSARRSRRSGCAAGATSCCRCRPSCSTRPCARSARAGFVGANVTVPHKHAALALADRASAARARDRRRQHAELRRRRRDRRRQHRRAGPDRGARASIRPGAARVVLGAGGTARAAVWALREAGAAVAVWNRTPERARELAAAISASSAIARPRAGGSAREHDHRGHGRMYESRPTRSGRWPWIPICSVAVRRSSTSSTPLAPRRSSRRRVSSASPTVDGLDDPRRPGRAQLRALDRPASRRSTRCARAAGAGERWLSPRPTCGRVAEPTRQDADATSGPNGVRPPTPPRPRRALADRRDRRARPALARAGARGDRRSPRETGTHGRAACCSRAGTISPDGVAVALAERYGLDYVDLTRLQRRHGGREPRHQPGRQALRGAAGRVRRRSRAARRDGRSRRTSTRSTTSRSSPATRSASRSRRARTSRASSRGSRASATSCATAATRSQAPRTRAAIVELHETADDAPVVKLVHQLVGQAVEEGASDLHITPGEPGSARPLPHRRRAARRDERSRGGWPPASSRA